MLTPPQVTPSLASVGDDIVTDMFQNCAFGKAHEIRRTDLGSSAIDDDGGPTCHTGQTRV
jgi:hypothetical protein